MLQPINQPWMIARGHDIGPAIAVHIHGDSIDGPNAEVKHYRLTVRRDKEYCPFMPRRDVARNDIHEAIAGEVRRDYRLRRKAFSDYVPNPLLAWLIVKVGGHRQQRHRQRYYSLHQTSQKISFRPSSKVRA